MILFTDLDGTLLDDKKVLTPGNRQAIEEALQAGHKIVITTGRPLASGKILARELGLDKEGCYVIAFNGGEIYDMYHQESIFRQTLSIPDVVWVFREARKRGLHCQTYDSIGILSESDNPCLRYYKANTNIPAKVVPDIAEALQEDPVKLIVIDTDHEKLLAFREETAAWAEGKMDRIFSTPQYLEHVAPGISKGGAIRMLCEKLQIPLSQTIAAGDAENDLSMIETAAVGAVMCNAEERIRARGTYITKHDNNHDGVAEIIRTFML
ncbi:MAG: Cof-type HAD-IIB family hydrolase [Eubacteriales bacterium]|nr:Cof-type HAD-IIB family hydrolase [Eubacteriales bacterium]